MQWKLQLNVYKCKMMHIGKNNNFQLQYWGIVLVKATEEKGRLLISDSQTVGNLVRIHLKYCVQF